MSLSACLTCRHARKPRTLPAGVVLCSISGNEVATLHVCHGWDSLFSRLQNEEAGQGGKRYGSVTRTESLISEQNYHG